MIAGDMPGTWIGKIAVIPAVLGVSDHYHLVTKLAQAEKRSRVAQLSAMIHEAARTRKSARGETDRVARTRSLPAEDHSVR